VLERLKEPTAGKGPEKCIDAVGMEAHASRSKDSMYDRAKQAVMLETDRPHDELLRAVRKIGLFAVDCRFSFRDDRTYRQCLPNA
jgi:uncharacterized protein (DUF934 family)